MEPIDIVWLKKDIRLHDHGPLSMIAQSSPRQCIILYLYEPDQLCEKTVHGSHIEFINEGIVDLDQRLSGNICRTIDSKPIYQYKFRCITVCYAGAAFTLQSIHKQRPIHQILCHLETGHLKSFARDNAVRRWCRANNVVIHELDQTGVTRCLSNRDDFTKNFHRFLDQPLWETPTNQQLDNLRQSRLITLGQGQLKLYGVCATPLMPSEIHQIPNEHKHDRVDRQHGGETSALSMFESFLTQRGCNYSSGISSPITSWTSCSRLSPYLTWGNISVRYVIVMTRRKQAELREIKKGNRGSTPSPWLRSLASFQSRMHWRSHFMQKLESQPSIEEQDQCLAFSHLRRQPGDFNQDYFDAWCRGRTGFPFVDACMRCLIKCGWVNFRMRAMLVTFATYNLWLDWKVIAPHLARLFLDYEPGIHYPQLQMQAGTTGINTMRVYNVTKQGKDQDPQGVFIRKYVPELKNVPNEYIHEPSNMPVTLQKKCGVLIHKNQLGKSADGLNVFVKSDPTEASLSEYVHYPYPIVDEKLSAKVAKEKVSAVRKQQSTKDEAKKVYLKHGSRRFRNEDRNGATPKDNSGSVKRVKVDHGQKSLFNSWKLSQTEVSLDKLDGEDDSDVSDEQSVDEVDPVLEVETPQKLGGGVNEDSKPPVQKSPSSQKKKQGIASFFVKRGEQDDKVTTTNNNGWDCKACTFHNDKPFALACSICGSIRD